MAKVTVYRIEIFNNAEGGPTIPNRWFTRDGADMMKPIRVLEDSAVEIDEKDLDPANPWMTAIGYRPD